MTLHGLSLPNFKMCNVSVGNTELYRQLCI
jgi:hypothetical protein